MLESYGELNANDRLIVDISIKGMAARRAYLDAMMAKDQKKLKQVRDIFGDSATSTPLLIVASVVIASLDARFAWLKSSSQLSRG